MAGREFSSLLGRQKREILRMIGDPKPKKRKFEDFKEPSKVDVPGVLLPEDGDLSLVNRNKRMFKQLVGTLERFRKEDTKLPGIEARMRSLNALERDSKGPPEVSRVLQKHEDPSLVNRDKRMFRQLLGNLERFRKQDEELSVNEVYIDNLEKATSNAEYQSVPKRRAMAKIEDGKNVDDIESKDDQDKDSVVDGSVLGVGTSQNERTATQLRNEVEPLINYSSAKSLGVEKRKDQTVSTSFAAKAGKKDLKVQHKLQRFPRTKVEPQINYPFIISSDANVPSIEQEFAQIGRKTNFMHIEKIGGKEINILQGLELYTNVFGPHKQKEIVDYIYELQLRGQNGQLKGRTYSEPKKWMQGKGRITIQCGCCYNYATDRNGNPPGVLRNEEVEPLPTLFKEMIKKLVRWQIIPTTCVPDSCIVNIYEVGDCIPPHIDHHDFLRPFCTVSFLAECKILFGSNLEIVGPGKFKGPVSIPLPVGSVLIINGNGADIAKHCVPGVHDKRISITFRKMDKSKLPYNIIHDPE